MNYELLRTRREEFLLFPALEKLINDISYVPDITCQ